MPFILGDTNGLLHVPSQWTVLRAAIVLAIVALPVALRLRNKKSPSTLILEVQDDKKQNIQQYDVIIVGGGTAGCVLASRLTEDPSIRVLVLEAGGSGIGHQFAEIPAALFTFLDGVYDYGLYTKNQASAAGRKRYWPRARLLGGCSNVNAMMFHYGAPSDYDEWARIQKGHAGASAWTYDNIHPYFNKFERFVPSQEFSDVDVSLRGVDGPMNTGYFGHFSPLSKLFLLACEAAGISHNPDPNTFKGTLGAMKIMTYIKPNGRRATTETAYLTSDVLNRPNLTVITKAAVARILFDESGHTPRAVGVEFKDASGSRRIASAKKEVIICAGAVHTPHILMLSGIGPASHLSALGIPVVANLPGVGSHLKDHIVVDLAYMDKTKESLSFLSPTTLRHRFQLLKALVQYKLTGRGPLTCNVGEVAAFVRSDDSKVFPPAEFSEPPPEDTSSGKGAPDIELFFSPLAYAEHSKKPAPNNGQYNFMQHSILLRPKSSGTIRLNSADPSDPPIIDPQYLADPNDVKTLIRSVRLLDKLAHTEPLASAIDPAGDYHPELHHELSRLSDREIEQLIKERVETLYHPTSSARMAPLEDDGVVDPYLRVHGVPNLRIVDASVFPEIISGHTAAPVIAIAEKAADIIKHDFASSSA